MKNISYLFLTSVIALVCLSCKPDSISGPSSYQSTVVPEGIDDLYEFRGDANAETVWIFLQGGPQPLIQYELESTTNQQFLGLRVYPYQVQQINKSLLTAEDFDHDKATKEIEISMGIFKRVVDHFKGKNKKVYLMGHSYGAFLVQEFLSTYGSTVVDGAAVWNARLDLDDVVWQNAQKGIAYKFDNNGENPSKNTASDPDASQTTIKNASILLSPLGKNRYTEKLKNVDLSNTLFFGTENDEAVGKWTSEELAFLEVNAGKMLLRRGDHSTVFYTPNYLSEIKNFLVTK